MNYTLDYDLILYVLIMMNKINLTPILYGEYGKEFIKDMDKKPSKKEKDMFNRMKNPTRCLF